MKIIAEKWRHTSLLVCMVCVLLFSFLMIKDVGILNDEVFHHDQILRFMHGDWSRVPELTIIPGYHALIAAFQ